MGSAPVLEMLDNVWGGFKTIGTNLKRGSSPATKPGFTTTNQIRHKQLGGGVEKEKTRRKGFHVKTANE